MKTFLYALAVFAILAIATAFALYAFSAKQQTEAVAFAESKGTIAEVIEKYGDPNEHYICHEESLPPEWFAGTFGIEVKPSEHVHYLFLDTTMPCRAILVIADSDGKVLRAEPYNP